MIKKIFWLVIASLVWGNISLVSGVCAQGYDNERIIFFHSTIKVSRDSSLTVTETIKVNSTGNQLRHGIYRDFPTRYKDKFGRNHIVGFRVIEVLRDGQLDGYHFQNLSNGRRLYIGKKDFFLSPGIYTYTLVYKTDRQLGFFRDFDELYWNVTGNDWAFPIDQASATVELPPGASEKVLSIDGYTGPSGAKGKDFLSSRDTSGNTNFVTTRPFRPGEGLTIVVSWPKGYVAAPTALMKLSYFISDNRGMVVGLVGLLLLLVYYLAVWARFGKDPAKGTIIPLYTPPDRFSPAAIRYIMKMGYDNKNFTAAVIDMAVKGYLTIKEEGHLYTLAKTGAGESILTPEETAMARELFGSTDKIELKNTNHEEISGAIANLQRALKNGFEKIYFFTNRQYFVPGLMLSILILIAGALLESRGGAPVSIFLSIWLTIWTFGVIFLLKTAISTWRSFIRGGGPKVSSLGQAVFFSLFSLPFVAGEVIGVVFLIKTSSISVMAIVAPVIVINFLFYRLLKASTLAGRKIMDRIEGFKMYLSVAEKDRLNILNPPEKTPELFEKYLPYALAMDVEQVWAEQFAGVLQRVAQSGRAYSPGWYSGRAWSVSGPTDFVSSLGSSFSSAVSSSSTAPGSSSGGGGGGSSGGGGGGGGGGGW